MAEVPREKKHGRDESPETGSAAETPVPGPKESPDGLKLEEKLNRTELQRDDAVEQLRRIWDENCQLWRQNADLRERLARLEERFIGKGSVEFSERAG